MEFLCVSRSYRLHPLSPQRKEEAGGGGFRATERSDGAEDHENVSCRFFAQPDSLLEVL